MKAHTIVVTLAIVFSAGTAVAQSGGMKGMEGMDHQSMKMGKSQATHKTTGVVKRIDAAAGTVSLAHEPVKTLDWPAMTMKFQVKDKAMLDKLSEGTKVEVEFEQRGKEYVITSVK